MSRYLGYDLTIDFDIEPPGAMPLLGGAGGPKDIEIRLGAADIDPAARAQGYFRYADGRLLFAAPGVARYLCEDGRQMVVQPEPNADEEAIKALLIATALPALLWMRALFVLHASALVMPGTDRAIAVAGRSGAGKSSILHCLLALGASAVADDSIAIKRGEGDVVASGLSAAYFLPTATAGMRNLAATPPDQRTRWARLGAIFVLDRSAGSEEPTFERFGPLEALQNMLRHQHRPRVPFILGRLGPMLDDCTFIARSVPMYIWRRPEGAVELSEKPRYRF